MASVWIHSPAGLLCGAPKNGNDAPPLKPASIALCGNKFGHGGFSTMQSEHGGAAGRDPNFGLEEVEMVFLEAVAGGSSISGRALGTCGDQRLQARNQRRSSSREFQMSVAGPFEVLIPGTEHEHGNAPAVAHVGGKELLLGEGKRMAEHDGGEFVVFQQIEGAKRGGDRGHIETGPLQQAVACGQQSMIATDGQDTRPNQNGTSPMSRSSAHLYQHDIKGRDAVAQVTKGSAGRKMLLFRPVLGTSWH
jgi:hypothetical protein